MQFPKIDPLWLFGFCLLGMIATLAGIIAIGHVTQEGSYGLTDVLGILAVLSGGFAQKAFSSSYKDKGDKDGNSAKP